MLRLVPSRVARPRKEKLSDKGITSAAKRVGPLRQQTDLPRQAIIDLDHWRHFFLVAGLIWGVTAAYNKVLPGEEARHSALV